MSPIGLGSFEGLEIYGQIFLPASVLSVMRQGEPSRGLDLSKVDDILVRFDYVTVAR